MPITVTAPNGVLTAAGRRAVLPRLTEVLLEVSGLRNNEFFTSIVGGTVHVLDPSDIYAGGVNRAVVLVEVKLANIGLPTPAARAAFVTAATDVIDAVTIPAHDRANTWVNIINAPDGGWGIGGTAYTGDALAAAASGS
ncbi:hypothetical protein [Pseudonocardia spinosispora]|uniref:hypothetical protein n=1 Tax=Pseudonocardia spinosispora TaxID=103441 RepID=UPI0003F5E1D5|nr:hypothetical protein [Pseudonocardia spinosispora]